MLTTVASFGEPWEAHMFRSRLQADGVPALVSFENHIGVNWPWSTALQGVVVQVPHSWVKEAAAIWQLCAAGEFAKGLREEFGDIDDPKCPVCGSQSFRKRRRIPQAIFCSLVTLLWVLLPPIASICTCRKCGVKWKC